MADRGPNYSVERRRLMLTNAEHQSNIAKGKSRIEEIQRQKEINQMRLEVTNAELDSEIDLLLTNEASLSRTISDNNKKLELMVRPEPDPEG